MTLFGLFSSTLCTTKATVLFDLTPKIAHNINVLDLWWNQSGSKPMKICLFVRDMVMLVSPNIVFRGARGAGTDRVGVAFEMYVDPGGRRDGSLQVWGVNWILLLLLKKSASLFAV